MAAITSLCCRHELTMIFLKSRLSSSRAEILPCKFSYGPILAILISTTNSLVEENLNICPHL